jgi:hypothetical protein
VECHYELSEALSSFLPRRTPRFLDSCLEIEILRYAPHSLRLGTSQDKRRLEGHLAMTKMGRAHRNDRDTEVRADLLKPDR